MLNAAPPPREQGRSIFAQTDVLIVNETELARFAGEGAVPHDDRDALVRMAGTLRSRPDQTVIVTLGACGALVVSDAAAHVPGRPVRAIDATGAGDCFCGVLSAALAAGADIVAAAATANLAASLQVTRPGAATAMPWRAEIDAAATAQPPA